MMDVSSLVVSKREAVVVQDFCSVAVLHTNKYFFWVIWVCPQTIPI